MAFGPDKRFELRTATMTRAQAEAAHIDVGLREYMLRVYNYMASGLALTGIIAYLAANTPAVFNLLYAAGPNGMMQPTMLAWLVMLSPLAFVMVLSFGIQKMQATLPKGSKPPLFCIFISLSPLLISYPTLLLFLSPAFWAYLPQAGVRQSFLA